GGTELNQIAVLFRSSAHSQALEFELMKRDLPYDYRGGQKFFERAHIRDVLSYLRLTQNVKDEVAWLRVLNLEQGIGASTASQIIHRVRAFESLPQIASMDGETIAPARGRDGWQSFTRLLESMLASGPLPSAMIRSLCRSSYRDYLEREYPNFQERLDDLEQLALFSERYEDATAFLNDIALFDDVVSSKETAASGETERLVLSTIHQAKGLEWDTVFVMHLADAAFPNRRALGEEGGMEEERRLFYVAVTRAKRKLFLTYPMTVGYETLTFSQPSTFIEEVPSRLFDRVEIRQTGNSALERRRSWSWDNAEDGYEEPVINVDRYEEPSGRSGGVILKPSEPKPTKKPGSFLRDIDEL
ncbi:MAG TPA: ATP-dependent helicase, partial [Patescibacteria group bacterium]|nr:ATP-dependent helicase [Patescibacteria group bacterium]